MPMHLFIHATKVWRFQRGTLPEGIMSFEQLCRSGLHRQGYREPDGAAGEEEQREPVNQR